jgi:serine/threonine protein kinase
MLVNLWKRCLSLEIAMSVSLAIQDRHYVLKCVHHLKQCFPQLERDLLLRACRTKSNWAPHLLCAFQTSTHLNLVMDFAEGGTLWDVLESSPLDGRISESDITWWAPQIVSAINWCHQEGFVHRCVFNILSTCHGIFSTSQRH